MYPNLPITAKKYILDTCINSLVRDRNHGFQLGVGIVNLLLIVPESTADGITACAKISEIAAVPAKKRHVHIIHKA